MIRFTRNAVNNVDSLRFVAGCSRTAISVAEDEMNGEVVIYGLQLFLKNYRSRTRSPIQMKFASNENYIRTYEYPKLVSKTSGIVLQTLMDEMFTIMICFALIRAQGFLGVNE